MEDADVNDRRKSVSGAGARAAYFIERWKFGLMVMITIALAVALSALLVKIPMEIIGALLDRPAVGAWGNVLPIAGAVVLPFVLTAGTLLDMLDGLAKLQRAHRKAGSGSQR